MFLNLNKYSCRYLHFYLLIIFIFKVVSLTYLFVLFLKSQIRIQKNCPNIFVFRSFFSLSACNFCVYYQSQELTKKIFGLIILLNFQDSPDGEAIFEPDECYDILSHFHTIYIKNLPLIHVLTFGVRRLKFLWPFKRK